MNSGLLPDSEWYQTGWEMAVYGALLGRRSVLLAPNLLAREDLLHRVSAANKFLATIAALTDIKLNSIPTPIVVYYDVDSQIIDNATTARWLQEVFSLEEQKNYFATGVAAIELNHTGIALVALLEKLSSLKIVPPKVEASIAQQAKIAERLAQKSSYVTLFAAQDATIKAQLPEHISTGLISFNEAQKLGSWQELIQVWRAETKSRTTPRTLFVKSASGSGGEFSERITGANFSVCWPTLISEIKTKLSGQILQNEELLLQAEISGPKSAQLPLRIGIWFYIGDRDETPAICATSQLYSDASYKTYFGSYWDREEEEGMLRCIGIKKLISLSRLIQSQGFRGPCNVDFMLTAKGKYVSIFDLNPRMTGIFPLLAVGAVLDNLGIPLSSIANFSNGGVVKDSPELVRKLRENGRLFTRTTPTGMLVLPSLGTNPDLGSPKSLLYDVVCVNCTREQVKDNFLFLKSSVKSTRLPAMIY